MMKSVRRVEKVCGRKLFEEANLVTESKDDEGLIKVADTGIITSISGTPSQQTIKSPIITKNSKIPSLRY